VCGLIARKPGPIVSYAMGMSSITVYKCQFVVWLLVVLLLAPMAQPLSTPAAVDSLSTGQMMLRHGTLVIRYT
jgi:hypothetical protein